jgi:formimidoylglutamate deiminase
MITYRLQSAYLPQGWARDVLVTVDDGMITALETGAAAAQQHAHAERIESLAGIVIPGMPNAHSHAFQRAMAGNAEFRMGARDSFWTWRQMMYALANRITPQQLQIVATQLFVEMLKAGYTSVAEFHYLHRAADGSRYAGGVNPLWEAISHAARAAGIGLTFLPTLYQSGDFGGQPLKPEQARFNLDTDEFLRAVERRIADERRANNPLLRTGAAFHSLRAVPLDHLRQAALALRGIDESMPVHVHVAEQILEVRACEQATGRRPVQLLLEQELLTPYWCVVHATHASAAELAGLAAADAVVCVSISTEANLGDGFFDAARFLNSHGRLCVGSDSQATVSPAEELRWLEYQQRLRKKRRGVLAAREESRVGTRLWREAAESGARALGQPVGRIAVGCRADWLVLDREHPSMAGAAADGALDRLLFAGASQAIRDVMVGGQWVVKDGRHAADEPLRGEFDRIMVKLGPG